MRTHPTNPRSTTDRPTGHHPCRPRVVALVTALTTLLLLLGSTGPAAAHSGHLDTGDGSGDQTVDARRATLTGGDSTTWSVADTTTWTTLDQLAGEILVDRGRAGRIQVADGLVAVGTQGGSQVPVECLVDFDDDLVLQYLIPNAAEDTFMTAPWYQACNAGNYYPAVSVTPMEYGHFHLGYEDNRIGPCGDPSNWGRHDTPPPADGGDYADWFYGNCTDIDPITEPRSGIMPHLPGHRAQIKVYEGHVDTEYLPFQLRTLRVTGGSVEVCHLPPGPIVAMPGGGSPWQCTTVGEGYWNLSNIVDSAIEVRVEFLDTGILLDNIGIDVL